MAKNHKLRFCTLFLGGPTLPKPEKWSKKRSKKWPKNDLKNGQILTPKIDPKTRFFVHFKFLKNTKNRQTRYDPIKRPQKLCALIVHNVHFCAHFVHLAKFDTFCGHAKNAKNVIFSCFWVKNEDKEWAFMGLSKNEVKNHPFLNTLFLTPLKNTVFEIRPSWWVTFLVKP